MMAVMRSAGVTSKAGLSTAVPSGAVGVVAEAAHFVGAALLDGDVGAVGHGQVHGGHGRGDVEGDPVVLGQHREGVGADLVGGVAVAGDAVGARDHDLRQSLTLDARCRPCCR